MGRVGIIGPRGDETERIARAIESCGGSSVFIDSGAPGWSSDGFRVAFRGQSLDDVAVFYVKGIPLALNFPEIGTGGAFLTWPERYMAERERHSLMHSALRGLELDGRLLVNPLSRFEFHFFKLYQIASLSRAGIVVPASIATNDPRAALAFANSHDSVAAKPLGGGALVERLTDIDFTDERLGTLAFAPVLLQEYVDGDEYRVYVLDGAPIATLSIPTAGVADARERVDEATYCVAPIAVAEVASRAATALELVFTAVDIRVSPDGRVVVLECNPTPALGFYDKKGTILNKLARFLVTRS
jgi:glutathione synthase/RimK-type ligase-like ATP-grasp enzyme